VPGRCARGSVRITRPAIRPAARSAPSVGVVAPTLELRGPRRCLRCPRGGPEVGAGRGVVQGQVPVPVAPSEGDQGGEDGAQAAGRDRDARAPLIGDPADEWGAHRCRAQEEHHVDAQDPAAHGGLGSHLHGLVGAGQEREDAQAHRDRHDREGPVGGHDGQQEGEDPQGEGRRHGIVRIAFDRPDVRNAFRPHTVDELYRTLDHARRTPDVGCVLITGNGPSTKDGGWAFCSGGDQRIRGRSGYRYADGDTADTVDEAREKVEGGRLHILEVQRLIRTMPKVVIAVVNGWAAGGGHSLHVVCDLTVASRQEARFKQTDADVGSFDAGYGSAYLAKMVGQKYAREIFFLGRTYDAERMQQMGAVNVVADHGEVENEAIQMAMEINGKSPTAQRMLKFAFNLTDDGLMGQQVFAGEATRLAYMTDEAVEGKESFLEKREPDWSPFPYYY